MEEEELPEYIESLTKILQDTHGKEFIDEFFMSEDLENYIRERNDSRYEWDDPMDWVNGMSVGITFTLERCLDVRFGANLEAKFKLELALWLYDLIRRIERNE
tara:strand:- start:550 stop:858 length:309 start_codon:yes stop_codon:yes gene_type:complete